jgi:amidase
LNQEIDRRAFVVSGLVGGAMTVAKSTIPSLVRSARAPGPAPDFALEETTVSALQDMMKSGQYSARSVAELYLARIDAMDKRGPALNAVIELNPDALDIADALDAERKAKGPRGPLHGIPVLIKDNIATADKMQTTAGSLALVGSVVPRDSFVAERLRAAGAVILGKTNLSEWANFRSTHSTSGWSGRGGQTRNPYALDRNPSGSSSGSAAACSANFCAVAVGTETDGSIVSPSQCSSLVGIKPTVGLVSGSGIVPISHTQDTAGPMCRTVRDAAILLGALAGVDYTGAFDPNALKGARIGVARGHFWGYSAATDKICEAALDLMKQHGAIIVDPANLATAGKYEDAENIVLQYEFKADLNAYLAQLTSAQVKTMADVIAFNTAHAGQELPYFGQETMLQSQARGPLTSPEYLKALATCRRMSRAEGIDATMTKYRLDAIVAPTGGPPWLTDLVDGDYGQGGSTSPAAVAGYPSITVPCGYSFGLPAGISFFGRSRSEAKLIGLAFAFEQAAPARKPPAFKTTADLTLA